MQRTPLYQFHVDNGGKMVDFAGWEMPLTYFGLTDEHKQVRTSGGIFDVSHMGRVKMTGRHARKFLDKVCSRKIADMVPGQCRYSLVCNEQGGVRDDVIVYRIEDDDFLVVVNASNREKLMGHFNQVKAANDFAFKMEDQTLSTGMVALQGPKVIPLIAKISSEVPTLKKYRFTIKNLMIVKLIVSRTGYTGEDGVEVILPSNAVGMVLKLLGGYVDMSKPDAFIRPAGLGARDTLRTEAGMPLYGHELGEEINALSCGVDFAIALDKNQGEKGETFIGLDALLRTRDAGGPARKLAGFFIDGKRSARQGMIIRQGGKEVGVITSGCPSPTLGRCIAMGFLDKDLHAVGTKLEVDSGRGEPMPAEVTSMPFYKAPKPS